MCHKWPRICSTCRKHFRSFPHSWLITGFVTRLTRRVQELLILPEHLSGVRVTRSLVLCVCFVDRYLSFCTFAHCLSILLRYTDSDYPFGIFKLFFELFRQCDIYCFSFQLYTCMNKHISYYDIRCQNDCVWNDRSFKIITCINTDTTYLYCI